MPARRAAAHGRKRKRAVRAGAKRRKKKGASRDAALPDFVPPSLATSRDVAPSGREWVHEIKFDGYRMQARLDRGKVKLLTRKGLDWAARFPNIAADVARLAADTALIDGEIVVENSRGVADFSMLQAALSNGERDSFVYYVFDLLHLDGEDLSRQPLIERKAALKELLDETGDTGAIRYSEHFTEDGSEVFAQACRMSLEGIVSKLADAPYRTGRSDSFIKVKCARCAGACRRRLCAVHGRAESGRCAGGGLLSRRQADLCRPRRHRLYPRDGQRVMEAVASVGNCEAAVRCDCSGRGAPPRRALGRTKDRDRIAFSRLDQRRHRAAGRIQRRARGQAGEGSCSRAAGRGRATRKRRPAAPQRNR